MSTSSAARPAAQTIDIPTFAGWLGIHVATAYELAHRDGAIAGVPVIRVGSRRYLSRAACEAVVAGHAPALPRSESALCATEEPISEAEVAALRRAYRFLEDLWERQQAAALRAEDAS